MIDKTSRRCKNVWRVQIWNLCRYQQQHFYEYLSFVIAHLSKESEEYKAIQNKIESLYQQYPKVLSVFDKEQATELTNEECTAVIKVTELKNMITDMELQSVYFRGCYDSVEYLKKKEIL